MRDLNALRDEIAGQVVAALVASRSVWETADVLAKFAYDYADAMVEESVRRRIDANRLSRPDALDTPTEPS